MKDKIKSFILELIIIKMLIYRKLKNLWIDFLTYKSLSEQKPIFSESFKNSFLLKAKKLFLKDRYKFFSKKNQAFSNINLFKQTSEIRYSWEYGFFGYRKPSYETLYKNFIETAVYYKFGHKIRQIQNGRLLFPFSFYSRGKFDIYNISNLKFRKPYFYKKSVLSLRNLNIYNLLSSKINYWIYSFYSLNEDYFHKKIHNNNSSEFFYEDNCKMRFKSYDDVVATIDKLEMDTTSINNQKSYILRRWGKALRDFIFIKSRSAIKKDKIDLVDSKKVFGFNKLNNSLTKELSDLFTEYNQIKKSKTINTDNFVSRLFYRRKNDWYHLNKEQLKFKMILEDYHSKTPAQSKDTEFSKINKQMIFEGLKIKDKFDFTWFGKNYKNSYYNFEVVNDRFSEYKLDNSEAGDTSYFSRFYNVPSSWFRLYLKYYKEFIYNWSRNFFEKGEQEFDLLRSKRKQPVFFLENSQIFNLFEIFMFLVNKNVIYDYFIFENFYFSYFIRFFCFISDQLLYIYIILLIIFLIRYCIIFYYRIFFLINQKKDSIIKNNTITNNLIDKFSFYEYFSHFYYNKKVVKINQFNFKNFISDNLVLSKVYNRLIFPFIYSKDESNSSFYMKFDNFKLKLSNFSKKYDHYWKKTNQNYMSHKIEESGLSLNKYQILSDINISRKNTDQQTQFLNFIYRDDPILKDVMRFLTLIKQPSLLAYSNLILKIISKEKQHLGVNILDNTFFTFYNRYIFNDLFFKIVLKEASFNTILKNKSLNIPASDFLLYKKFSTFGLSRNDWIFRYDISINAINSNAYLKNKDFFKNTSKDWIRIRTNFFDLPFDKYKKKIRQFSAVNTFFLYLSKLINFELEVILKFTAISVVFIIVFFQYNILFFIFLICITLLYISLKIYKEIFLQDFFPIKIYKKFFVIIYFYIKEYRNILVFYIATIFSILIFNNIYNNILTIYYIITDIILINYNLEFSYFWSIFENIKITEFSKSKADYLYIYVYIMHINNIINKKLREYRWFKPYSLQNLYRELVYRGFKDWNKMGLLDYIFFRKKVKIFENWKMEPYMPKILIFWHFDLKNPRRSEKKRHANFWYYRFFNSIRNLNLKFSNPYFHRNRFMESYLRSLVSLWEDRRYLTNFWFYNFYIRSYLSKLNSDLFIPNGWNYIYILCLDLLKLHIYKFKVFIFIVILISIIFIILLYFMSKISLLLKFFNNKKKK
jgi:hypothetical protein